MEKAIEFLRKKGVVDAGKKASRETKEGSIASYIHSNLKIGVLLEVSCETDFVARGEEFQGMLKDLCLHIAAMNPIAVSKNDVPPALLEKERGIYATMDEVLKKPENFREKIIAGKLEKFLKERCLLEQAFVKDSKMTVNDYLQSKIAVIKENMVIRRFIRYELGA
jgi:elongation factor Ts